MSQLAQYITTVTNIGKLLRTFDVGEVSLEDALSLDNLLHFSRITRYFNTERVCVSAQTTKNTQRTDARSNDYLITLL
jgi:hypothetical protein